MNKRQRKKDYFKGWTKKERSELRKGYVQYERDLQEHILKVLQEPCFPEATDLGIGILTDD